MSGTLSTGRARRRLLVEFVVVWACIVAVVVALWAGIVALVLWQAGML